MWARGESDIRCSPLPILLPSKPFAMFKSRSIYYRFATHGRDQRNRALIGPDEGRVVDTNVVKKVFRPMGRPNRLQNDSVALPSDRYRSGLKAEFIRQWNGLPIARFNYFNCFHDSARLILSDRHNQEPKYFTKNISLQSTVLFAHFLKSSARLLVD